MFSFTRFCYPKFITIVFKPSSMTFDVWWYIIKHLTKQPSSQTTNSITCTSVCLLTSCHSCVVFLNFLQNTTRTSCCIWMIDCFQHVFMLLKIFNSFEFRFFFYFSIWSRFECFWKTLNFWSKSNYLFFVRLRTWF